MSAADISFADLALIYLLLVVPFLILHFAGTKLLKTGLLSVVRMTLQLLLVGMYLKYIFQWNSLALNVLWILAMTAVATSSIMPKAGLRPRPFFRAGMLTTLFALLFTVLPLLVLATGSGSVFEARYLIPVSGMILGNCLRGNVIALDRFYSSVRGAENEYVTRLMLGATRREALFPYFRDALKAASAPNLATMATMGLVSLPGMMTGQILGGSLPVTAIKYQILICIGIFTALILNAALNIVITARVAFDDRDMLRRELLAE